MPLYETYLTIKQAAFDLPDLQVNPKNKITRLLKGLQWGMRRNGKIIQDYDTLFDLTDKDTLESIGADDVASLNIASCVDKANRVSGNMPDIGALATLRSDWAIPHITPLFKYKGKYYTRNSGGKFSSPYDSLDEIGDRWYRKQVGKMPIPDYVDFYDLPAGATIDEKDIRKVIDEVKRKAGKSYRKYYNNSDKYTIHGAILGCLGNNAKKFDYSITEKLPNDPWKAIINTKPMTMEQVQQFHKYHNKDVDNAGVPYYFLTRNERTGEKAVWYSDDPNPIPINNKKEIEYAQQVGKAKGLVPDQLNFKFTKESSVDLSDIVNEYKNQYGFDLSYMKGKHSKKPRYNNGKVANDIPVDAYGGSWAKNNTIYLNPNMDAVAKYYGIADATGLQNTIVAHELAHEIYKRQATQEFIKQILEEAKKKKFTTPYLATVPEHKLDEETFCEYLANGLNKQASRLYTYVDPDADLSQGLLSLRNAPEEVVVRRYGNQIEEPENRNKDGILKWIEELGNDPSRPDWIYALDAPIPDNANEGLLRFRDARKLVSWDPEQVKDIIQILRRYNNPKTREEVSANFKPLKHIRWDKSTPTYKILTESGRIPAELLREE